MRCPICGNDCIAQAFSEDVTFWFHLWYEHTPDVAGECWCGFELKVRGKNPSFPNALKDHILSLPGGLDQHVIDYFMGVRDGESK